MLPLKSAADRSPSSVPPPILLPSILGNYVGTPLHPVTPLDGMMNQFKSTPILYAQGSTLAEGFAVPVPRTAFGLNKGLKTEFFATPDWTGRPVATDNRAPESRPTGKMPSPHRRSTRPTTPSAGAASIAAPAPGHYVFSLEPGDSLPLLARGDAIASFSTARCLSEGSLRAGTRSLADGTLQVRPRRLAHRAA